MKKKNKKTPKSNQTQKVTFPLIFLRLKLCNCKDLCSSYFWVSGSERSMSAMSLQVVNYVSNNVSEQWHQLTKLGQQR